MDSGHVWSCLSISFTGQFRFYIFLAAGETKEYVAFACFYPAGVELPGFLFSDKRTEDGTIRITSYNVCYTKLLRATHSSGNHAAALALAARMRGVKAHIVMPETSPEIKKKAVAGYGASITFCKPTLQARESTLAQVVAKTGATEIHPYNNFHVIAGQGTAAIV